MAEKKKQHYVPQFYMKQFSDNKKTFCVFHIADKKILSDVPYKGQCYKDYYYGKDGTLEDKLSVLEGEWAEITKKISAEKDLTFEDINKIKQFALYQRQRTVAESEHNKLVRESILMEEAKVFCNSKGIILDEETMKGMCRQNVERNITPAEILEMAEKLIDVVEDLAIVVINYNTEKQLISSDVPVVEINPFHLQTIGVGCMGIIILFPISPTQLVVLYDSKMYPKYQGNLYINSTSEEDVDGLNALQLISAEKILYAKRTDEFTQFKNEDWESRKRNRESEAISVLGSSTEKMIATSPRKCIYKYSFTFAVEAGYFKRVPYPCREAVPRKWDQGWENKLKEKGKLLVGISKFQPEILGDMSKSQFLDGCRRMYSAAIRYWFRK